MPCSHADTDVSSCLVGSVNWVRNSRRQFSIYWIQNSFVQSRTSLDPVFKHDVTIGNHVACELETGSEQDKTQSIPHFKTGQHCFKLQTVLTCRQFRSHREHLSCRCRRCEPAIRGSLQVACLELHVRTCLRVLEPNSSPLTWQPCVFTLCLTNSLL